MKRFALAIAFCTAGLVVSAPARAQSPASTPSAYVSGPWQRDAVAGIQRPASTNQFSSAAALESGKNQGQPIALMAVGGAAIILGALMNNDAGPLLVVGGTVLGLYGLYLYLR